MRRTPARRQAPALALTLAGRRERDAALLDAALERLRPLVPEAPRGDVRACALEYVERYQGDVLQLEHEREFLCAALLHCWRQGDDDAVVRLVGGLAHLVTRIEYLAEAEGILRLGIEASRRMEDRRSLALYVNRLGGVLFTHGHYRQGWRFWRVGLRLAEPDGYALSFWEPFTSFAPAFDIAGGSDVTQELIERSLRAYTSDEPGATACLAVALFIRGVYARLTGDARTAERDLYQLIELLSTLDPPGVATPLSGQRQMFCMAAQAELARTQGAYARAQAYTETALTLASVFGDRYTVASLLVDQGLHTLRQGRYADTIAAFVRLRELSRRMDAPHLYHRSSFLERELATVFPGWSASLEPAALEGPKQVAKGVAKGLEREAASLDERYEPLSGREREVLLLVAAGFSNHEIAERLSVTPATVKKHLEHIYARLDTHSRTSAIVRARALKLLP